MEQQLYKNVNDIFRNLEKFVLKFPNENDEQACIFLAFTMLSQPIEICNNISLS